MKHYSLLFMMLCFMVACDRIDLHEYNTIVKLDLYVDLSINEMPDTSVIGRDHEFSVWLNGQMPSYAEVLIYHPKSGDIVMSQMVTSKGGLLKVPTGNYDMVVYSLGTEMTQVKHLSNKQVAEAFTSDVSILYADKFKTLVCNDSAKTSASIDYSYENHAIMYSPDHVYVSNENHLHIPSYVEDEEYCISASAKSIVEVYSLEVFGIQGLENIHKVDAFVTGQVKSSYFAQAELSGVPATLYVPMKIDYENQRLYTVFGTFGKLPGEDNKVYLDIILTNNGGECFRYVYDVTEQFDDAENENNRLIISDSISVPKGSSSVLSDIPVNAWDEDTLNIVI